MNIITADEAIAQGTTPGAIISIARNYKGETAVRLRKLAHEVARRTNMPLRAANDNGRKRRVA